MSSSFSILKKSRTVHYLITKDSEKLLDAMNSIDVIPEDVEEALEGIKVMKNGVSKLPKKYPVLKEAKKFLLEVIDLVINEFSESKVMAIKIRNKIDLEI